MSARVAVALGVVALLGCGVAGASGQFVHLAAGDRAIFDVDSDLRNLLLDTQNRCGIRKCREIYRNGLLFPDAWGKQFPVEDEDDCTEQQSKDSGTIIHTPDFMNKYASKIVQHCAGVPPLGRNCDAVAAAQCSNATIPAVCEAAARAACRDQRDECEQHISFYMGSVAHSAMDATFDKFFVNSVAEHCDIHIQSGPSTHVEAQYYTDQHMDVFLGRGERGDPPSGGTWGALLPEREGVTRTVTNFLRDEVLVGLLPGKCEESTRVKALRRQQISLAKTSCGVIAHSDEQACEPFVDLGICCLDPDPTPRGCNWAVNSEDRWRGGPGGIRDGAEELALLLNEAWRILKRGEAPRFQWHTTFADRVICVGRRGQGRMVCSRADAAAVTVLGP